MFLRCICSVDIAKVYWGLLRSLGVLEVVQATFLSYMLTNLGSKEGALYVEFRLFKLHFPCKCLLTWDPRMDQTQDLDFMQIIDKKSLVCAKLGIQGRSKPNTLTLCKSLIK